MFTYVLNHNPITVCFYALGILYIPMLVIRWLFLKLRTIPDLLGPYFAWSLGEAALAMEYCAAAYILQHVLIPAWIVNVYYQFVLLVLCYIGGIWNHTRAERDSKNTVELAFFRRIDQKLHDYVIFGGAAFLLFSTLPLFLIPGDLKVWIAKGGMLIALCVYAYTIKMDGEQKNRFAETLP